MNGGPRSATAAAASWGVTGLQVRYGHTLALQEVSLQLAGGSVAAVVGGDGAGKSTLLRALAGAVAASAGSVRRPAPSHIGYVSSGTGVYADLTVLENVLFSGRAYGLSRPQIDGRAAGLLERAGLGTARDRLAGRLSGGMRQKLAFVLSVLHQPALLVLDEPTTGVDPVSRTDLWRLIAAAAADGAAVVMSTTYLDEAERAANVLVLQAGRVLLTGPPDEVRGAIPGALFEYPSAEIPEDLMRRSWRHGGMRRLWMPDGRTPGPRAARVTPTLADAVIVASLQVAMEIAR